MHKMSSSDFESAQHLRPLTSIRFIAAMMIVLHHCQKYYSWEILKELPITFVHGVTFFFVLSGFILAHVYSSRDFPGYRIFIQSRIARIWPVHIFAILGLMVFGRPGSITFFGYGLFDQWVQLVFQVLLLHAVFPYWSYPFSWNSVSWSISTEFFFYLCFPFLLANFKKSWWFKLSFCVVLPVAGWSVLTSLGVPFEGDLNTLAITPFLYTNPIARIWEFCLGMTAWFAWKSFFQPRRLGILWGSLLELTCILGTTYWLFSGFFQLRDLLSHPLAVQVYQNAGSCLIFAILILCLASSNGIVGRILSLKLCVFLGQISFAIYMVHQILLKFFASWLPKDSVTPLMFFFALIFIASGTHLMIENPLRKLIMRWGTANR
jgi:peptidoglycan/LPS O-acetylase OafA/YrhL